MQILGRAAGLWFGRDYSRCGPECSYVLQLGFGEGSGEEYDRLYRHNLNIQFRPLWSCFVWYRDLLTVENGKPVYQDRICGFRRWPLSWNWS